jgi:hypothetical protein
MMTVVAERNDGYADDRGKCYDDEDDDGELESIAMNGDSNL